MLENEDQEMGNTLGTHSSPMTSPGRAELEQIKQFEKFYGMDVNRFIDFVKTKNIKDELEKNIQENPEIDISNK